MFNSSSPASRFRDRLSTIAQIAFRGDLDSYLERLIQRKNALLEGTFTIRRYHGDAADYANEADFQAHNAPYSVTSFSNGLLLTGVQAMYAQMIGTGTATANTAYTTPTFYSNAQSSIGVGDSSAAFANTQTGLQATTNKAYEPMQASYPSIGTGANANVVTFQSSFGSTSGNFAWNEFCVYNSPADTTNSIALGSNAIALNRAVSGQGTKSAGSTWQITYTLTIS